MSTHTRYTNRKSKQRIVTVRCPAQDCDAERGDDYTFYAKHVRDEHAGHPEDFGLPPLRDGAPGAPAPDEGAGEGGEA